MSIMHTSLFIGREIDIKEIDHYIYKTSSILILYGNEGIGKTSLINEVINRHKKTDRDEIFIDTYNKNWESIIFELAKKTIKEVRSKINIQQLENEIIKYFKYTHSILILDNIDNSINCNLSCSAFPKSGKCERNPKNIGNECNKYRITKFDELITKWKDKEITNSSLVLIQRKIRFEDENITIYEVKAFDNKDTWIKLLGKKIESFIDSEKLDCLIKTFNSNTQKFVYLKMCNPDSWGECLNYVNQINTGKEILESIYNTKDEKLTLSHFYALGLVEIRDFDETLFAYLWDRLGGGATEEYVKVLRILLQKNAISHPQNIKNELDYNRLEVTTGIHKLLAERLEKHFGENNSIISYLISQYYLKQFDKNRRIEELELLERSVKHALSYGSFEVFEEIYSYVFEEAIWSQIRNRGQLIIVKKIIDYFDEFIDKLKDSVLKNQSKSVDDQEFQENLFSELDKIIIKQYGKKTKEYDDAIDSFKKSIKEATIKDDSKVEKYYQYSIRVKIEKAKCSTDLCDYLISIKELQEAQKLLDIRSDIDEKLKIIFQTEIRHFTAIAYSCMGDSQCIIEYTKNVKQAIANYQNNNKPINKLELLSLGYLAHEWMFLDINEALSLGQKAYKLSIESGDGNLIKKNSCNYGKILLYSGFLSDAINYFKVESCEKNSVTDKRELGRITLQKALIAIKENNLKEANSLLKFYENERDDKRRYAVCQAYKGISLFRGNKEESGRTCLLDSIKIHNEINDKRHLIFEILTYIWTVDQTFIGDLNSIDLNKNDLSPIEEFLPVLKDESLEHFIVFWRCHFKTQILSEANQQHK